MDLTIKLSYENDLRRVRTASKCTPKELIELSQQCFPTIPFPKFFAQESELSSAQFNTLAETCSRENKPLRLQVKEGTKEYVNKFITEQQETHEDFTPAIEMYKKSIIEFENYMIRSAMTWKEGEREAWIEKVSSCCNFTDLHAITITFIDHIAQEGNNCSFDLQASCPPQETMAESLKALFRSLKELESTISWSNVIPEFSDNRYTWIAQLTEAAVLISPPRYWGTTHLETIVNCLLHLNGVMRLELMLWNAEEQAQWVEKVKTASSPPQLGVLMNQFVCNCSGEKLYHGWSNHYHETWTNRLLRNPSIRSLAQALVGIECSIGWSAVEERFKNERQEWLEGLSIVSASGSEEQCESSNMVREFRRNLTVDDSISFSVNITKEQEEETDELVPFQLIISFSNSNFDVFSMHFNRYADDDDSLSCVRCYWGEELICDTVDEWINPFPIEKSFTCTLDIHKEDALSLTIENYKIYSILLPVDCEKNKLTDIHRFSTKGEEGSFKVTSLEHSFRQTFDLL